MRKHSKKSNVSDELLQEVKTKYITPYSGSWNVRSSDCKRNTLIFDSDNYERAVKDGLIPGQGSYKLHVALNVSDIKNIKKAIKYLFREIITKEEFSDLIYHFKVETPTSHMRKGAGITIWIPPNKSLCGGNEEKAAALWYKFGLQINKVFQEHEIKTVETCKTDRKLFESPHCVVSYRIGPNGSGPQKSNKKCYNMTGELLGKADCGEIRKTCKEKENYNPLTWDDPISYIAEMYQRSTTLFSVIKSSIETPDLLNTLEQNSDECTQRIQQTYNTYNALLYKKESLALLREKIESVYNEGELPSEGFKSFESTLTFKTESKKLEHGKGCFIS